MDIQVVPDHHERAAELLMRGAASPRRAIVIGEEACSMDGPDVWVASEEGTDIIRAPDISGVSLDDHGNVTARLAGGEGTIVTLVAHRAHHDEQLPGDLHRQLIRVIAQLSDSSGAHLVRPVHAEPGGWQWVTEPL